MFLLRHMHRILRRAVIPAMVVLLVLASGRMLHAATTIDFWTTEVTPERQAVVSYLADVFMIHNPDVIINIKGVEENEFTESVTLARKNNEGPDLVSCASEMIVAFGEQGWTCSGETGAMLESIGKQRFFAGTLNRLKLADGSYCGIPFNGWVQGIWYRRDWFDAHGLEAPDTWDNILKAARTLHDPDNGRYGILMGTRGDVYAEQIFTHLALSAGARMFSPQGTVVFNSPAALKTLRFYKELARYTPPGPQSWRGRDFYLQGRLAMMFYSTFIMDDLAIPSVAADSLTNRNFPELDGAAYDPRLLKNTGMVSTIREKQKAGYGVLHALGILNNGDRSKEQAVQRFMHFLFTEPAYVTWLHMVPGGMLPVLKDTTQTEILYRDAQGVFHKYSRRRIEDIVSGFDTLQSFSFVNGHLVPQAARISSEGILTDMLGETLQKGVPPKQALQKATSRIKREIH